MKNIGILLVHFHDFILYIILLFLYVFTVVSCSCKRELNNKLQSSTTVMEVSLYMFIVNIWFHYAMLRIYSLKLVFIISTYCCIKILTKNIFS